ncbi:MAG: hypothetical protein GC158_08900 [Cyanobacteria bacterium RI_101]|nr:hypothetical protein [Cyanobacteria bacterium RI_101]
MTYQYNLEITLLANALPDGSLRNGSPSYLDADVSTNVPSLSYLNDGVYDLWCIDREISFLLGNVYSDYFAFSSTEVQEGLVETPLRESSPVTSTTFEYASKIDNINWLLNQSYIDTNAFGTGTVSVLNVQQAIWALLGQLPAGVTFSNLNANVQALVTAANNQGEGFIASANQKQGLVISNFTLNVNGQIQPRTQPFLLVTQAAQLGDTVWLDADADGIQDEGEAGIAGVTVKLLRDLNNDGVIASTEVVATTTTNANGFYDFKGLTGGFSYQVLFDPSTALLPAGSFYQLTQANQGANDALDSDAVLTGGLALSQVVTLAPGEYNQTLDAGFIRVDPAPAKASLGNFVWNDANANGVQDDGEAGIEGVKVYLLFEGKPFRETTTDENGFYIFEDLDADTYQVQFFQPEGFIASPKGQGDSATDSEGLISAPVILEGGDDNDTIDAGFYQTAALGNFVWNDLNANGIQEDGEAGIDGVTVNLLQNGSVIDTATTDANGFYQFTGLTPGAGYQVEFVQPTGFSGVSPTGKGTGATDSEGLLSAAVTLAPGENNDTLDAGFYQIASIEIEKFTNGVDADTLDDAAEVVAGETVTWTYMVTNTGEVDFALAEIIVTDDQEGLITNIVSKLDGDDDDILESGETWVYEKTGVAQSLTTLGSGAAKLFDFSGSSALDGQNGNIRTFSVDDLSLKASAFSRDNSGVWDKVFLGSFSSGLGVTDNSEGNGGNDTHRVDNVGEKNFVLFEFSETVIVDSVFLNAVLNDSDITYWVGNVSGAFTNLTELSDSFLSSLALKADDDTNSSSARWADINNGEVSGNVLVIAASTSDATPEDRFKIDQIKVKTLETVGAGFYKNTGAVVAGSVSDQDDSHYVNIDPNPGIDIEKFVNGIDVADINDLPEIAAGTDVTFTYAVTNTGNVSFAKAQVVVKDDNGTINNAADDFLPTLDLTSDLNNDGILSPGETWWYASATEAAQNLAVTSSGNDVLFDFNGSSSTTGSFGNVRSFSAGGVSVDVSAFRNHNGSFSTAYLGLYGGGLGVTNAGESGADHRLDNGGSLEYILFEFNKDVIVDKVFLDYVQGDSDISVWIGDRDGADIANLSQSLLNSFGKEDNNGGSSDRWADFNAAGKVGDTLIIAAKVGESNDSFKLEKLDLSTLGATTIGNYVNTVTVQAGGVGDSDKSGYTNPGGQSAPQNPTPPSNTGLVAPGAGTPGFWQQNGLPFWDGIVGNESKAGEKGFPHGELLTTGAGVLLGDFNRNGITDNGEDTLFIKRSDAVALVSNKSVKLFDCNKQAQMLGRSAVASWLNYLAGNPVELVGGGKDIADYLGDAIDWLDAYQSGGIGSSAWKNDPLGLGASGEQIHTILDQYNNGSSQYATGNFKRC